MKRLILFIMAALPLAAQQAPAPPPEPKPTAANLEARLAFKSAESRMYQLMGAMAEARAAMEASYQRAVKEACPEGTALNLQALGRGEFVCEKTAKEAVKK